MKTWIVTLLPILLLLKAQAQPKIHAHNDYQQKTPLKTALQKKAEQIEADIFLINDTLFVAHAKKDIKPDNTLNRLYLEPIAQYLQQQRKFKGGDKNYRFSLMIDIKENFDQVYPVLKREIEKYGDYFDASRNRRAVKIVISGDRPARETFSTYPKWLFFDGLPQISYTKNELKKIALISAQFSKFSKWKGNGSLASNDEILIKKVINEAHQQGKQIRFWGAPDQPLAWKKLVELGVDYINTDKIVETRYFLQHEF